MSLERLVMANACLFTLAAARIAGYVVVSPFPGANVGRTQRVALVVVLAWVSASFASTEAAPQSLDVELFGRAVAEVALGVVIGAAFRFVFAAAEVLGGVLGQMTGLSSPSVLNPTLDAPETAIGRLVGLGAMLLALTGGVHRIALGGLLESFRALPLGLAASFDAPALRLVDLGVDAFVVGVRLATPVVAVTVLVQLALAIVSRAAPSVQIFSVGFGVLFTAGTVTLIASLDDMLAGLGAHFGTLASSIDGALTAMRR